MLFRPMVRLAAMATIRERLGDGIVLILFKPAVVHYWQCIIAKSYWWRSIGRKRLLVAQGSDHMVSQ